MISGIAGDQQAATIGQACFAPGMIKSTYGTGCFALLEHRRHAGRVEEQAAHHDRLPAQGPAHLRAGRLDLRCRISGAVAARRARASSSRPPRPARSPTSPIRCKSVDLVPAFVGLGAPYWIRACAARCSGSPATPARPRSPMPRWKASATRPTTCARGDARRLAGRQGRHTVLRVDGGMTASDWTLQRLADLLDAPVDRPMIQETTAPGAAYLAGLARRRLSRTGKIRRQLAAGTPLQAGDERGDARAEACGLGKGGERAAGER